MRDVLSISVDDLIYVDNIRTLFGVELQTPNMDRLAEMGVSFSNAFCTTAVCSPSRASIMTSQSPFTTGVHYNDDDWVSKIKLSQTLPNIFRDAGYTADGFGKTFHQADQETALRLFDRFVDHRDDPTLNWTTEGQTPDALNLQEFIAALQGGSSGPSLMMVGLHDPHDPFLSPSKYTSLYPLDQIVLPDGAEYPDMPEFIRSLIESQGVDEMPPVELKRFIQGYLANITEMDNRLGEILDAVEDDQNYDPVIALWSDHGYSLGDVDHDYLTKFTLWDETGRIPLIIVDPDAPAKLRGTTYDGVISTLDIAPTLLDLAGLSVPGWMQGQSLKGILSDPDTVFSGTAITTMFGSVSIRTNEWRYTRYEDGSEELFRVATDPENVINLANHPEFQDERVAMRNQLETELLGVGVVIHEERDVVSVDAGSGESTYFVASLTSEIRGIIDDGGTDHIYLAGGEFVMPEWAENVSAYANLAPTEYKDVKIIGNNLTNIIQTHKGNDFIDGNSGADFINSHHGNDKVIGGRGHDKIFGDLGDDYLSGGRGIDEMNGGKGRDTLVSSHGDDVLTGGGGPDTFTLKNQSGATVRIADFEVGLDKILTSMNKDDATITRSNDTVTVHFDDLTIILKNLGTEAAKDFDL